MVNVAWPYVAALVLALILGLFMLMHLCRRHAPLGEVVWTKALLRAPAAAGPPSVELCRIISTS